MMVTQSDLDSFHDFATNFLARADRDLSLEELITKWRAEREYAETVDSICRGVADAHAGRVRDLSEVDQKIRRNLGLPASR
jgi:hypothetical protein